MLAKLEHSVALIDTTYNDMYTLAAILEGTISAWKAGPRNIAMPTIQVLSSQIEKTHELLEKFGYSIKMSDGRAYQQPSPGQSEPFTHSWFVAISETHAPFVVRFLNINSPQFVG